MADERFIDAEPIEGTNQVTKVWDATFLLPRAVRALPLLSPDEASRIRERVRTLARVRHPALPPLVAVGEAEGCVQLVESWVDGRSVEQLVEQDGPLSIRRALGLLSPVVDALRAAHELGIGHGGVDGRSLMLDQVGVPQLVGMGAREGSPADDVSDLGFLMSEVTAEPWPDTLRSLVDEAMGGQLTSLADMSERLRLISADLDEGSDESELDFDFDFDFEFDPDEVMYDEAAVAGDRRVLALVALGVLAIIGVGIYGATLPERPDPLAEADPAAAEEVQAPDPVVADQAPITPPAAEERANPASPTTDPGPDATPRPGDPQSPTPDVPAAIAPPTVVAGSTPEPMTGHLGKWHVERASEAPATALLEAENEVRDRLDQAGRPQLALLCGDDGLVAQLRPGVERVEATTDESTYGIFTVVEVSHDGMPEPSIRGDLEHHDGSVYLPVDRVRSLVGSSSVLLRYLPFAGDPVVALFDVRGMRAALGELGRCG